LTKAGPDWSHRLPRPPTIPGVMTLATLADVRTLMRHLRGNHRNKLTSQHVATELDKAAAGPIGSTSPSRSDLEL
jgi:hypothetical protein